MKSIQSVFALMLCLLLALPNSKAQTPPPPVISSFSPSSGASGTVVEIYGTNLEPPSSGGGGSGTLQERQAFFVMFYMNSDNFATAQVLERSSRMLRVRVPSLRQNNQPLIPGEYTIQVGHAGGTASSSTRFTFFGPPVTNVSFIHGYNSNGAVWNYARGQLQTEFNPTTWRQNSYNTINPISLTAQNSASTLVPFDNTVVIAHSMGGLVAREIRRQQGINSNIDALITIGTPHRGAPIVNNAQNDLNNLINDWISDLAVGWRRLYLSNSWVTNNIVNIFFRIISDHTRNEVLDYFGISNPSVTDMRMSSPFLNTLNSAPSNTFPFAHYTIRGKEDWLSHWRLGDAAKNDGTETGEGIEQFTQLNTLYIGWALQLSYEADFYLRLYLSATNWEDKLYYWQMFSYFQYVMNGFVYGHRALVLLHQAEFNGRLIGEGLTRQDIDNRNARSDAFIPSWSQTPNFVNSSRQFEAISTNHLEQTGTPNNPEPLARISDALRRPDINLRQF
ncbi:MAG: IPT/TIG domain-containing protein [Chloroherpetonaceae bacterium]